MTRCFSLISLIDRRFRSIFLNSGLRPTTTKLGDGTVISCWAPKAHQDSKPNLLLLHGFGANATWQWADILPHMTPHFNVYVPDLLFFGESYTSRPERTDSFQAQCMMRLMEAHSVKGRLSVLGLSYGGFVAYSMAAQYKEVVERVVICSSAVIMEERDLVEGKFNVPDVETAADLLLAQTPEKFKELLSYALLKPPKMLPNCVLKDFIQSMCTEYCQERRELLHEIPKDRKISKIPKLTQPTLIMWGEQDKVFPLEFGYRLKNHLGDNAELVVITKSGHLLNMERPRDFCKRLKAFLITFQQNHSQQNGN